MTSVGFAAGADGSLTDGALVRACDFWRTDTFAVSTALLTAGLADATAPLLCGALVCALAGLAVTFWADAFLRTTLEGRTAAFAFLALRASERGSCAFTSRSR